MNSGILLTNAACHMVVPRQFLPRPKAPSALPVTTGESIKVAAYPSTLLLSTDLHPSVPKTGTGVPHFVSARLRPPPPLLPLRLPLVIQGMVMEMTMGMATEMATGMATGMAMAMKVGVKKATNTAKTTSDPFTTKLVLLPFALWALMLVRSWMHKAVTMSAWILPRSSNPAEDVYRWVAVKIVLLFLAHGMLDVNKGTVLFTPVPGDSSSLWMGRLVFFSSKTAFS